MTNLLMAALLVFAPSTVDLPPEAAVDSPAVADMPAARGPSWQEAEPPAPPPTAPPGPPAGLSNCDEMHWYRVDAGLPAAFDRIGWRESNCRNEEGVHTSCCWGYWQLNVALHLRDSRLVSRYRSCGVDSRTDVDSDTVGDKLRQACAAKALYDVVGLSAWAATA